MVNWLNPVSEWRHLLGFLTPLWSSPPELRRLHFPLTMLHKKCKEFKSQALHSGQFSDKKMVLSDATSTCKETMLIPMLEPCARVLSEPKLLTPPLIKFWETGTLFVMQLKRKWRISSKDGEFGWKLFKLPRSWFPQQNCSLICKLTSDNRPD